MLTQNHYKIVHFCPLIRCWTKIVSNHTHTSCGHLSMFHFIFLIKNNAYRQRQVNGRRWQTTKKGFGKSILSKLNFVVYLFVTCNNFIIIVKTVPFPSLWTHLANIYDFLHICKNDDDTLIYLKTELY